MITLAGVLIQAAVVDPVEPRLSCDPCQVVDAGEAPRPILLAGAHATLDPSLEVASKSQQHSAPQPGPWQLEVGGEGSVAGYTAGEILLGVDVTGRARIWRPLLGELRVGAREAKSIELDPGSATGRGFVVALGLAADVTPAVRWAGLSIGVRSEVDFLSYLISDGSGATYQRADVTALTLQGTATAFISVAEPLSFTLNAAVGTPLHAVVIQENDVHRSGLRGVLVSLGLGLAARF